MKCSVVPEPEKFEVLSETAVFTLTRLIEIESECEKAKNNLLAFLWDKYEIEVLGTGKDRIILKINPDMEKGESYTLKVSENLVEIYGRDEAGVFYGVQTLIQLLICGELSLPEISIEDSPRFAYRGFMLDCARYFFTVDAVKHFLDLMALHKLNSFHWHLSDDQGFRFGSEEYPLLTQIGSNRSHTGFNSIPHEGYYTKQDMLDIVQYAHDRCIKVIPEIDSPGHVVSMIAAHPGLSCADKKMTVATSWGIKEDVLCVGKESTYTFIYRLLEELCEIFTDGIIHIGGDEVPTTRWKSCPHCQALMKKEGMTGEKELHTYYLSKIADFLKGKGIEVCMWNDSVKESTVGTDIIWQLWNGEMDKKEVADEINKGRRFILSPSEYYYFDFPYGKTSLEKVCKSDILYEGVRDECKNNIMGVECCLWTEFVPTMERAHYTTFPRFGAFSETAWTSCESRDCGRFSEKLGNYYKVLNYYGVEPAKPSQANPKVLRKAGSLIRWGLNWAGTKLTVV